jgi:hypothetical protein
MKRNNKLSSCPWVFVAGVQCTTSAFGDEPRRMLKITHHFCKYCSCHLQGLCVMVGRFWQPAPLPSPSFFPFFLPFVPSDESIEIRSIGRNTGEGREIDYLLLPNGSSAHKIEFFAIQRHY